MFAFPKNALIYRFTKKVNIEADALEQSLAAFSFKPCGDQDVSKIGWTKPLGEKTELLLHTAQDWLLLTFKEEKKIFPPKVLALAFNERVDALELEKGRKLGKREKDDIKDAVIVQMLPRAFSKYESINVFINCSLGFIVVDASSSNKAEFVLSLLRKTLGSLPIVPASPHKDVSATMTTWLNTFTTPKCLQFGYSTKLTSTLPKGPHATFNNQALDSEEIKACLEEQKVVSKLGLTFKDRLSFVLTDKAEIKQLKYSVEILDANNDISDEDELAQMDADICLVEGEFSDLLTELYSESVLGGFDDK